MVHILERVDLNLVRIDMWKNTNTNFFRILNKWLLYQVFNLPAEVSELWVSEMSKKIKYLCKHQRAFYRGYYPH